MGDDRPIFRRERSQVPVATYRLLMVLALGTGLTLLARSQWEPRLTSGLLVEVSGDVPRPGTYLLETATLAEAVRAAGGDPSDAPTTPIPVGHRVVVSQDGVRLAPTSDPLLVALPVDVNVAGVDQIAAIPGVGLDVALAIIDARDAHGPYRTVEELARARGVGPSMIERLAPFVTLGDVEPPSPTDLNAATAAELERLPGIGPVTAARIVVDRAEHGPYRKLEDLRRVRGIGPSTVEALRGRVVVGAP